MRVLTHPYPYTYSVVGCIYAHAHHTQHRDSTHHTPPYTPLCATYRHVPCVGRVVIPGKRMRRLEGRTEASMGKCLHMGGLQRSPSVTAVTNMGQDVWQGASVLHVRPARTTTELHQSGKRRTQWALRGPHAGTLPMVKHARLDGLTDVLGLHQQLHGSGSRTTKPGRPRKRVEAVVFEALTSVVRLLRTASKTECETGWQSRPGDRD